MAETSQQMADRNVKARSAFHSVHPPLKSAPLQLKTYLSDSHVSTPHPLWSSYTDEESNLPARSVEPADEQSERDEPSDADDEVGGPVDEGPAEGEQPDDGEEDAEPGHDVCVDEAALVPGRHALGEVQVVRGDAQDNGGEDELRQAEDHGDKVGEDHGCGSVLRFCDVVVKVSIRGSSSWESVQG
jgi:hypothetical protein